MLMREPPLLAVPNVSEGRDHAVLDALAAAFTGGGGLVLLDRHADADHHRAVLTLAGRPGAMAECLVAGAAATVARIDVIKGYDGRHPHVGSLDVMPIVYLDAAQRGAACAEALVIADRIGEELHVPVFLYGELAGGRTRAQLRRGGLATLRERLERRELKPDFGPPWLHPTAGATLVAAREPLVAFNLVLAPPATLQDAQRIATLIREGGKEGLPGLRAIAVALREPPRAQVSMNVERPLELALCEVLAAVARHAEVAEAELVGLAPRAALAGFPRGVPMPAFDPARQVIETALGL